MHLAGRHPRIQARQCKHWSMACGCCRVNASLRAHRLTELQRLRIVAASVGLVSIAEQSVQISCMLLLKRSAVSVAAMRGWITMTGKARIVELQPCTFTTIAHCLHVRDGVPVTRERLAGVDSRIVAVEAIVCSKPQNLVISSLWWTLQNLYICPCSAHAAVIDVQGHSSHGASTRGQHLHIRWGGY